MEFIKATLFAFTVGFCWQVSASNTHTLTFTADKRTLVQVSHVGRHLEVTVTDSQGITQKHPNFSPHFTTMLIVLTPVENVAKQDYIVFAKHRAFDSPIPPQISVLTNAKDSTLKAIKRANALFSSFTETGFDKAILAELNQLKLQYSNDPLVSNYLSEQLTYLSLQHHQLEEAFGHLSDFYAEMDISIPLYCSALYESLTKNKPLSQMQLTAMGQLSQFLIESQRQYRKTLGRISEQVYTEICSPMFALLKERFKELSLSDDFSPVKDAENLINAMILSEKSDKPAVEALIAEYSWFLFNYNNQYEQAENFARQAISLYQTLPESADKLSKLYSMLSSSLVRRGYYGESHRVLRQGLELKERISASQYSILLFNKGFFYKDLGEWDLAFDYLERSLEVLWRDNGHNSAYEVENCDVPDKYRQLLVNNLNQLGSVRRAQKRFDEARKFHQCALQFAANGAGSRTYSITTQLAKIELALGRIHSAQALLSGLSAEIDPNEPNRVNALLAFIELAIIQEEHDTLTSWLQEMSDYLGYNQIYDANLLEAFGYRHLNEQIELFRLLVAYHLRLRQTQNSPFDEQENEKWLSLFTQKALQIISTQQNRLTNPQQISHAKYRFVKTYFDTLASSMENLKQDNLQDIYYILEAFYTLPLHAEKNLFNASIEGGEVNGQLRQRFTRWHRLLREYILAPTAQQKEIKSQLDLAEQTFIDFNVFRSASKPLASSPLSLENIQQNLAEEEIILRYFVGEHTAYVLIVSADNIDIEAIPARQDVEHQILQLREQILLGKSVIATSTALAKSLLPKRILSDNTLKTLILILDDVLHQLPFSALNIASNNTQYAPLISRFEVLRTYSAEEFFAVRGQGLTETKGKSSKVPAVSVFAAPKTKSDAVASYSLQQARATMQSDSNYPRLRGAILEASYIEQIFVNKDMQIAIAEQATKRFLMSENSRSATILHIATHGAFQPEHPEIIGILAANGADEQAAIADVLSLSELLSVEVNNSLVVLSGCNTMRGRLFKATGMRSMTRGYLVQGAGAVIGTLWPVQDSPTAEFMRHFYQQLSETNNVTESLQLTQKHFSRYGRYRHPRYWAGFVPTLSNTKFRRIRL